LTQFSTSRPDCEKYTLSVNLARAGCNREVMDDDELIVRVADGDDVALRELFSRHAPWLAARLRAVLPAPDVEDVLQETFLAAWRGAAAYTPHGTAGGWLWGIARRQAALVLRHRGPATVPLPDSGPGSAEDPAEAVLARAELAAAMTALGAPGGPEREVWQLLYLEDRTVAEVAALTGAPEGTVKSRAHRARRLLRAALRGATNVEGGAR
jgi:RNA polymerase sigma-70 factor, ECF subfamily